MLQPRNEEKMSLTFCLRLVVHKIKITILNHILKKKKKKMLIKGIWDVNSDPLFEDETLMVKQKPIIHFEI